MGGKALLGGAVVLAAILAILLYQLQSSASTPPPPVAKVAPVATAPEIAPNVAAQMAALGDAPKGDPDKPTKVKPQSDAFFLQFDDLQPSMLTRQAAKCYHGGLERVHRNQKLKLKFKDKIVDGEVTVEDVTVVESTLDNSAMEACMVAAVKGTHWHNDNLPDWEMNDTLLIRPERGMKKFSPEAMADEGKGPIGPAIMKPNQPPPISYNATQSDYDAWQASKAEAAGSDR
jgi:hypothetical protein